MKLFLLLLVLMAVPGLVLSHAFDRSFLTNHLEQQTQERLERTKQQRERAKEKIAKMKPNSSQLERLTKEEMDLYAEQDQPWLRRTRVKTIGTSSPAFLANPANHYEPWQQAYRMLGAFIDCDHSKYSSNNKHGFNYQVNENGCSRWMMWAAYVDPNYQGKGYNEYHGENPTGKLDCHSPTTEWELLGIYRQEFYQFIEQISKHLWGISDYNYVVALASLAYMTDADCFYVDTGEDGKTIWAGIAPKPDARFEIALYNDDYCLIPNETLGFNFDSFNLQAYPNNNNNNNQNNQNGNGKNYNQNQATDDIKTWWYNAQEYTLSLLNEVYDSYRSCTSCMDYPTYQDGYFIGNYGTDEEDLINQCWKFYSHNSYNCESDCVSRGHAQGGLLAITYNGEDFGSMNFSAVTDVVVGVRKLPEGPVSILLANIFVSVSGVIWLVMFAAYLAAKRRNNQLLNGKLLDTKTMKEKLREIRSMNLWKKLECPVLVEPYEAPQLDINSGELPIDPPDCNVGDQPNNDDRNAAVIEPLENEGSNDAENNKMIVDTKQEPAEVVPSQPAKRKWFSLRGKRTSVDVLNNTRPLD